MEPTKRVKGNHIVPISALLSYTVQHSKKTFVPADWPVDYIVTQNRPKFTVKPQKEKNSPNFPFQFSIFMLKKEYLSENNNNNNKNIQS